MIAIPPPPSAGWHPGRLYGSALVAELYGCFFLLQPNQNGQSRSRENLVFHKSRPFLLQSNVVRSQKCRRNISETHEQDVCTSDWEECPSLRGWHVGKKPKGGQSFGWSQGNFRHPSLLQHEAQSRQVCFRGDGKKVPGVHGVSERYRGQPRQDPCHNKDGTPKECERSTKP